MILIYSRDECNSSYSLQCIKTLLIEFFFIDLSVCCLRIHHMLKKVGVRRVSQTHFVMVLKKILVEIWTIEPWNFNKFKQFQTQTFKNAGMGLMYLGVWCVRSRFYSSVVLCMCGKFPTSQKLDRAQHTYNI